MEPLAANHLQQAAEKIVAAVRLDRGLVNTKDHNLAMLIDGNPLGGEPKALPAGDPWRERILAVDMLSAYATTFRYSLKPPPKVEELRKHLQTISTYHELAKKELLG